jgi:hypothetical protein
MANNQFDHGPDPALLLQVDSERTNTSELSASSPRTWRSQLTVDFQPSEYSVICGRGKASYGHTGNHRLRMLASMFVEKYSQSGCNTHKSTIAAHIVTMTRERGGSFCKYEKGAWFEVGDHFAREKVSAMFRDMLHTQYRSSAKAKTARRRVQIKRNKTQTQQYSKQLIEGTGHSDDSSAQQYSQQLIGGTGHSDGSSAQQYSQQLIDGTGDWDDSSISSSWGSSTDSLGFDFSLELDFFDIDVFVD